MLSGKCLNRSIVTRAHVPTTPRQVVEWRATVKADVKVAAHLTGPHRMPSPADEATGDLYFKEVKESLDF